MVALWIILGILIFFTFILLLKATVTIEYSDEVRLFVRVAGLIKIRILPNKEKKVRLGHYSKRAIRRRERKLAKKEARRLERKKQHQQKKADKKKLSREERRRQKEGKPSLTENIAMIAEILKMFFSRFFKHLKIKVARLHIVIGTGDAAATALTFGAVCQAVVPIQLLLEKYTCINDLSCADISITPDFLADSTSVDVKISFSLRVWHLLDIGLRALRSFLGTRIRAMRRAARKRARAELAAEGAKSSARSDGTQA